MKHLALLLLATCLCACDDRAPGKAGSSEHAHGVAEATLGGLEIVTPAHAAHPNWVDLGDIPFGEVREKVVQLRNGEGRPLVVRSMQAGCSCTLVSLSYTDANGTLVKSNAHSKDALITLPEDVVAELTLRVDSRTAPNKNEDKLVIVRIVTDSESEPYFTLDVRMRVDAPFLAVPATLDLGRFPASGGGEGVLDIVPAGDRDRVLFEVASCASMWLGALAQPSPGGGPAYKLRVRVPPPVALGHFEATVTLRASGPGGVGEGPPFTVPVRGFVVDDLEVLPARLLLSRANPDAPERAEGDVYVRLLGGRLRVTQHQFEGAAADKLVAELTPLAPDDEGRSAQWHFAIEVRGELGDETLSGTLVLTTDERQFERIEIPWLRRGRAPVR